MRVTIYFLPVILLTVLSIDAFAQDPSPENALAVFSAWEGCDVELSDVRVGKQLQARGTKYWPVKAKAIFRRKCDSGRAKAGEVREIQWGVTEDGFGGYDRF